ncbi:MAG: SLOG family protein [Christensenellales bacterium]
MRVCFIGHRNIYENIREKIKETVENEIKNGCKFFTMGTHGEFDKMALSVCRELRETYKDIKIEVVITSFKTIEPIIDHDDIFGDEKYTPYEDVETIMYNIEETHYKRQIIESNHQMIDTCDTLICYVNKKHNPSGAKLAMNYAKRKGLNIINLYN